jgi:tetratricopeptide (TPR) repeat protein
MVSPVRESESARAVSNVVARVKLAPPQSQRPTLSPPRTVPKPAPAPVSGRAASPSPRPSAPARPVLPPSTRPPEPKVEAEAEAEAELDEGEVETVVEEDLEPSPQPLARQPRPLAPKRSPATSTRQAAAPAQGPAGGLDVDLDPRSEPAWASPDAPSHPRSDSSDLDAFETDTRRRRGIGPGLIALLGVVAAVGVAFGVPSIRNQLLSLGQGPAQAPPSAGVATPTAPDPALAAADAAVQSLGTAALARAEADLQRAVDAGAGASDPTAVAGLQVTLADLLSSRAIAYQIAAAIDPAVREDFQRRAVEDRKDSERILDAVQAAPDVDRLAEVRARARLAGGRAKVEVLAMIPPGAAEAKLIVEAGVLWQDLEAPVPEGLVGGLSGLETRTGLGDSVLALALIRAGDTVEARNVAERLLVGADDQIVGLAVRAVVGSDPDADPADPNADPNADAEAGKDPSVAKAPPRPGEEGGSSSGGSGGSSFDRLVEKGCSQVSGGQADAGIKTLLRAFDIKPKDLDVLVCLGEGYAAQGSNARANTFYDRALLQSPSNIPALRGAAKIAAKTGADARAKSLYERLLAADPGNGTAKAYLAKNAPQPPPEPPAEPDPQAPPTEPSDSSG